MNQPQPAQQSIQEIINQVREKGRAEGRQMALQEMSRQKRDDRRFLIMCHMLPSCSLKHSIETAQKAVDALETIENEERAARTADAMKREAEKAGVSLNHKKEVKLMKRGKR